MAPLWNTVNDEDQIRSNPINYRRVNEYYLQLPDEQRMAQSQFLFL